MATSKPQQILQLMPSNEITFVGPFDKIVTAYLELKNPSDATICFKVKTTAPRRYCVRPNHGFIEPNKQIRIAIMLQPIEQESNAERSRHKFMVQSTVVRDGSQSVDDIWKLAQPEEIMDSKLKCVFQQSETSSPPDTTTQTKPQQQQQQQAQSESVAPQTSNIEKRTESLGKPATDANQSNVHSSTLNKQSGFSRSDIPQSQAALSRSDIRLDANKSVSSSQNLTASFLQPLGDDHRIIIISFIMLIVGVILGKYII